jgi:hypothetical protein
VNGTEPSQRKAAGRPKAPKAPKEPKAPKAPKAPRAAKGESGPRGSRANAKYAGHRLYSKCQENPRRPDSIGFKSHEILLKNPGITYEEFLAKGGVPAALAWDIDKDFVRIEKVD